MSPNRFRTLVALLAAFVLAQGLTAGRAEAADPLGADGSTRLGWAVAVVDQASRSVQVLRSADDLMKYQGPGRPPVVWAWSADTDPHLADLAPARSWSMPNEAKARVLNGRRHLLTTATGGLAAVVDTASGKVRWAADTGGGANPHSLELLPDGNVAVAASEGGWLRVYTAALGPRSTGYAEFRLPGAHGVHRDGTTGLLWALGDHELVALRVGGPAAAPVLTAVRRVALPTPGGHDLAPVLAAPGRLWISTKARLWQYDPAADRFDPVGLGSPAAERNLKSVGDEPGSGRLLTTTPEPGNPCAWCTSVLTLHRPGGTRVLAGTRLYKARWWTARRS